MLHDCLLKYLEDVEKAVKKMTGSHVERYEEEILSDDRINLRIRIRFKSGYLLEINEAVISESRKIKHLNYRYHFQDQNNNLIFRYDNTPHFPNIESFPNHKHLSKKVSASHPPNVLKAIEEAREKVE